MILVRKFNKKEILKIIADFACESLPENLVGTIEAQFNNKNQIEIYFIEENKIEILS